MASLPRQLSRDPIGLETLPREVREQHRRRRAVDAATGVFARRGYLETTVDHLVAAADIGVGSFYELFRSKELCFLQVYDTIAAEAREQLQQVAAAQQSPPAQVCACLRRLLEMMARDTDRAKVALIEVETAGPRAISRHRQNLDAATSPLLRCRALSPYRDKLSPTVEQAIVGGVAWVGHQRLAMGEAEGVGDLYAELVAVALGPYFDAAQIETFAAQC